MTDREWWAEAKRYSDAQGAHAVADWLASEDGRAAFRDWRDAVAVAAGEAVAEQAARRAWWTGMTLAEAEARYADAIRRDDPPIARLLLYRWVIEPLRRALRPRRPMSHDLDEAVAQARQIPMSEVVAVNRFGFALCPFHDDHHPSLHVTAHLAYCFTCARGWDSLGLVMERDHLTFVEAVKRLGQTG